MPCATDRGTQEFLGARTIDRSGPPICGRYAASGPVRETAAFAGLRGQNTPPPRSPASAGEQRSDGSSLLTGEGCTFRFSRPRPGVLVVGIDGFDRGELGTTPFERIEAELAQVGALELFVDTRAAQGSATCVRESWTRWFARHRASLLRVHLLAGTRFLRVTLDITKELSRTGDLIVVYGDVDSFDAALARAASRPPGAGHAASAAP